MSTLRESDVQNSVRQLKEMFPQLSEATIERVLRDKRGVVDNAINVLLTLPPETSGSAYPSSSPPQNHRQQESHHHRSSQSKQPVHIFPADFLRWPPNAKVVREQIGNAPSPQPQEAQFVYQPPPADYASDNVEAFSQQPNARATKTPSGWDKFKRKFKSKNGKEYSQI